MSNAPTPAPVRPSLDQWMHARHNIIGSGLLAAAMLFLALPIWQLVLHVREETALVPLGMWGLLLGLVCLFGGLYLKLAEPGSSPETDGRYRLLALGLGGCAGLATFLFGLWMPLGPWIRAFVPGQATMGQEALTYLQVWRENWWRIIVCAVAVIGGLAAMFISLQLARSVERVSAGMRRLLYGYNAVLTGLLLLAILGLLNVLSYVQLWPFTFFDRQIDWTPSQMFTLDDRSQALLEKDLPGQIEIYALMPRVIEIDKYVETLCRNCQRYKKDIELFFYSPDSNQDKFAQIWSKYGKYLEGDQGGLIVVYHSPSGKEEAGGLRLRDLIGTPQPTRRGEPPSRRIVFKGENELMKLLRKLSDTKPARIVFTTGHGEMSLNRAGFGQDDEGGGGDLSVIKQRLDTSRNYEIKEVKLGVEGNTGLNDADVVVIARPTKAFPQEAVKALREYMAGKSPDGKRTMIVLLDKQVRGREMLKTNLEELLREYGVEVGTKRILALSDEEPGVVGAVPAFPTKNPIARAFRRQAWPFMEPRRLEAAGGEGAAFKAEPLLVTMSNQGVWEEANLTASPNDILSNYQKPGTPKNQLPKFATGLWVAVAVSSGQPRMDVPHDPQHAGVQEQVPRMVVFGDSTWATSPYVARNHFSFDLFDSCISWLRGKSDLGAGKPYAEDKERLEYNLAAQELTKSDKLPRIIWLPLALVFVAVVALAGGIWVVRRR